MKAPNWLALQPHEGPSETPCNPVTPRRAGSFNRTRVHLKRIVTRDKDGQIIRSFTLWQKDIENIGSIGNFVDSMDNLLGENETVEITVFYTD